MDSKANRRAKLGSVVFDGKAHLDNDQIQRRPIDTVAE